MNSLGLRIDVDTLRGTRLGVPTLCRILEERGLEATFFFSVGPDNMGRHLWRLLRPRFLVKMLRSGAPSLYGWDIVTKGTVVPGPVIGERLALVIRGCAERGHEIGLHAWDHHRWQMHLDRMTDVEIEHCTRQGYDLLAEIVGAVPECSACPAWRADERSLLIHSKFPFVHQSDCRGRSIFLPMVGEAVLDRPQIPTTLPTYDELIGRNGVTDDNYNDEIVRRIDAEGLNVLTIHAEVEGISRAPLFERFLDRLEAEGVKVLPLCHLLPIESELEVARFGSRAVPGRDGVLAQQGETVGRRVHLRRGAHAAPVWTR
ncbi:MAG: polysaccharide deacetylase family protein [Planctomycetota bacterium]